MEQQVLKELLTFIQNTQGFVLDQAPDLAQQIVAWEFWSSILWASLCVVPLSIAGACVWFSSRCDLRDQESGVVFAIFSFVFAILGIAVLVGNSVHAVKAYTSPKLVILDYVKDSLGGK